MPTHHHDTTWREKLPPICPGCGYNLTGIESARCPECGRPVSWIELRTNARTIYHALRLVEDVNDVVSFGLYLGGASLLIVLGCYALGIAVSLARVVGFVLALGALGTGLQAFRVRRFPEWAAEMLKHKPQFGKAACIILLALVTLVLAMFLPKR